MSWPAAPARWLTCELLIAAAMCGAAVASAPAQTNGSAGPAISGSDAGWRLATTSADDDWRDCRDAATMPAAQVGGAEHLAARPSQSPASSMSVAADASCPRARIGTPATGVGLHLVP